MDGRCWRAPIGIKRQGSGHHAGKGDRKGPAPCRKNKDPAAAKEVHPPKVAINSEDRKRLAPCRKNKGPAAAKDALQPKAATKKGG
ncbi:MAG: hypothetical protein CMI04_09060 [Oceanospirillaceae bacterium]|nr:hypothetical protein [Oceanospirillaceae bacterium]